MKRFGITKHDVARVTQMEWTIFERNPSILLHHGISLVALGPLLTVQIPPVARKYCLVLDVFVSPSFAGAPPRKADALTQGVSATSPASSTSSGANSTSTGWTTPTTGPHTIHRAAMPPRTSCLPRSSSPRGGTRPLATPRYASPRVRIFPSPPAREKGSRTPQSNVC